MLTNINPSTSAWIQYTLTSSLTAGAHSLIFSNTTTGDRSVAFDLVTIAGTAAQGSLPSGTDLYLAAGGTLSLDSAITQTVHMLYLEGVMQATGTWGSATSGAAHTNSHFTGDGILVVTTSIAADFTAAPSSGFAPLKVIFNDTSLGAGAVTNRHWTFGDGQTADATGASVTNTYTNAGTYTVALTVEWDDGTSNVVTKTDLITAAAVPAPAPLTGGGFSLNGAGQATFTFTTTNGVQYRIAYTDDLLTTNPWTGVTPPLPDGWTNGINGPLTLQDTNTAGATQRFYRVEAKSVDAP